MFYHSPNTEHESEKRDRALPRRIGGRKRWKEKRVLILLGVNVFFLLQRKPNARANKSENLEQLLNQCSESVTSGRWNLAWGAGWWIITFYRLEQNQRVWVDYSIRTIMSFKLDRWQNGKERPASYRNWDGSVLNGACDRLVLQG